MPYQTFPWLDGDSNSYGKLLALNLPRLENKSVLDVGCNTGFFCGFAQWSGASRVVGIDSNPEFINLASSWFPDCEFNCGDWMELGDEKFDIILFLSAIHYAPDQEKMLDFLVDHLNPGGMLVLEIGVAPGNEDTFVEVSRSIDKRFFPTQKKLDSILQKHAYKCIGRSVRQSGDPIPRVIYHIQRKKPLAVLLMDEPHSGKSAVSGIFVDSIKKISGDHLFYGIMFKNIAAPPPITAIVDELKDGENLNCASVAYNIWRKNLLYQLCDLIDELAAKNSFLLDMYVPAPGRKFMESGLEERGYFVVNVALQKARSAPRSKQVAPGDICEKYIQFLEDDFTVDEQEYLAANPDVAEAVRTGRFPSGQLHYFFHGRRERRLKKPE